MPVFNEKDKSKWTKDGRHYYYRCYYTDKYGKRKQKRSKKFHKYEEANTAEINFLAKNQKQVEVDSKVTFDTVFWDWLDMKKNMLKPQSYYGTKHKAIKYIFSHFSGCQFRNIHVPQIVEWYDNFWKNSNTIETNNVIIGYAYDIFSYGRDNYEIDTKILGKLQKKKNFEIKDKPKDSEINFWTPEEYNMFIKTVNDQFDKLLYQFLYYTGLRIGEMIALTWKDINFEEKTIRVNKSFTNKCEELPYLITDPKTKNSIRIVDLDDDLLNILKSHYKSEIKIFNFNTDMYMFGNTNHVAYTTFKNHLDANISKANIKRITPHGFRHSHVSLLIDLGCDSKEVAERIGDTVQVVERTYYHMFPKKKSHTVSVLNKLKNM